MVVAALVVASASPVTSLYPAAAQPVPPRGGGQPRGPALGVFPANATRVTARVQKVSGNTITLEIEDARPARPDLPMGPAAGTIEAVSSEPLPAGLTGRHIDAMVTLVGDTQASRWLVSEIRTLP
ncbi:MAG TPA: hypothetical protein VFW70_07630 [Methylomirabilota bacterium]|nr:hypothetical protein [Methylomirabilota bacterium]